MTDRATLEALLARVLEGTGPDRELDAEIAVALFGGEIIWKTARYTMDAYPARRIQNSAYVGGYQNAGVLAYTESLDATITLVPEGWSWYSTMRHYLAPVGAAGGVWQVGQQRATFTADAATPARALIAACLKAMMEAQDE
jgi:hypothetical protein